MDLINLLLLVLIWGVIFWVVESVIPMAPPFKAAARIILAVILILFMLDSLHLGHTRFYLR